MDNGFGVRLRRLRKECDITQGQLAEYLGVVSSAVGKYERVDGAYPSVETLIKIADYFKVSIDYLLRGTKSLPTIESNASNMLSGQFTKTDNGGTDYQSCNMLTPESTELLHIYEGLGGRDRLKLLSYAVELEESVSK